MLLLFVPMLSTILGTETRRRDEIIRHHQDYCFNEQQEQFPLMEQELQTLCGRPLSDVLNEEETMAFAWCPIEKINCPVCRVARELLESRGDWPR